MSRDERRYDREEVALVLRKLAELQVNEVPQHALDRAELEQVAREAGLDTRHFDTALAELGNQRKRDATRLGLRMWAVVSHSFPGQLGAAKLARAAAALDRAMGTIGEQRSDDTHLSWFGRQVAVSITQREAMISIQIEERFHRTSRGRLSIIAASSAPLLALITVLSGPFAALPVLALPVAYALTRHTHNRHVASTQRELEALARMLQIELEQAPSAEPMPSLRSA